MKERKYAVIFAKRMQSPEYITCTSFQEFKERLDYLVQRFQDPDIELIYRVY